MSTTDELHETAQGETDTVKERAKRGTRSAGFPVIALPEAVELTTKVANYGTKHTAESVAGQLGHSTANSGPFRSKVAALKDYGLLSGRGDEITVTPLGKELAHPGVTTDRAALLRTAFRSCELFATLLDALPPGVELNPESIANTAVTNHNVAPASKGAFMKSFVAGAEAAGFITSLGSGSVEKVDPDGKQATTNGDDSTDEPVEVLAGDATGEKPRGLPPRKRDAQVIHHSWPVPRGSVSFTVELSDPLPAKAYGLIQVLIEAGDALTAFLTENLAADDRSAV